MAASGLSCKSLGWHWVGHFLLLCTNGLRKQHSGHVGPPFLAVKLSSQSVGVTISQEL